MFFSAPEFRRHIFYSLAVPSKKAAAVTILHTLSVSNYHTNPIQLYKSYYFRDMNKWAALLLLFLCHYYALPVVTAQEGTEQPGVADESPAIVTGSLRGTTIMAQPPPPQEQQDASVATPATPNNDTQQVMMRMRELYRPGRPPLGTGRPRQPKPCHPHDHYCN